MLTNETIRDVGRALPWLASEPPPESVPAGVSLEKRSELLDAHAEGLRYDSLSPVIDRASHKLANELETLDPTEFVDPESEGAEALEGAEEYFRSQRDDLARLRNAFIEAGAPENTGLSGCDSLTGPLGQAHAGS